MPSVHTLYTTLKTVGGASNATLSRGWGEERWGMWSGRTSLSDNIIFNDVDGR